MPQLPIKVSPRLIGPLRIAIVYDDVQSEWLPASRVKQLLEEDPAIIWLENFGHLHGFEPDKSEYDLADYIFKKSREFEKAWCEHNCPSVVRVCNEAYEVRSAEKFEETFALMSQGVPVIGQAALWWPSERIYGTPDLLVHSVWLREHFPDLITEAEAARPATTLGDGGRNGHYIVLDLKFKTKLEDPKNKKDQQVYAAQVRLYSYMLGQAQGMMPSAAYIVTRDKVSEPIEIPIGSKLDQPLDADLAKLRDWFADIKLNGAGYLPWRDDVVRYSMESDERWNTAKKRFATEYFDGKDPRLVTQIGTPLCQHLRSAGFPSLDSLLASDPACIPIEKCKGYGGTGVKAKQIRAVLQANRTNKAIPPLQAAIPQRRQFEFFVDFEYFTNINVDFNSQWPDLSGCEMVFMIGVGWDENGWQFRTFVAKEETLTAEREIFDEFLDFLAQKTGSAFADDKMTALYHWTPPESWQSRRAADRHFPDPNHPLRRLPLVDLQKNFIETPCCVPGQLSFDLKGTAKNLGKLVPELDPHWPGSLDEGTKAMVMGWKGYHGGDINKSEEIKLLTPYLEADCRAVCNVLCWMRSFAP